MDKLDNEYIENWREDHNATQKSKFPAYDGNVWEKVIWKCRNWKASGPDDIQGYWWKCFP